MTEEWLIRSDREKFRIAGIRLLWVISALVHQAIGLFGIAVLSAFLVFTVRSIVVGFHVAIPALSASAILTQTPGFPVQACLGLLLGLILGRYSQRKIILWVWVLPFALFIYVLFFPPLDGSMFGPFYPPEAHHIPSMPERLSWSIIFIPSAAYALGAKLARARTKRMVTPQ
jgi:hypothetical protein